MASAAKNILVTGGAGFIGSALVRRLIADTPHRILNLDKLTYAASPEALAEIAASPRYSWQGTDVCASAEVASALQKFRPDTIVHMAAESHVDRSIHGPAEFVRTNVLGTAVMLEQSLAYYRQLAPDAQRAFRFLQVSTDEVYGDRDYGELAADEQSAYRPSSPYAATKAGADHLVRAWHRTYGLPVVITSSSNNYGPFQSPEKFVARLTWNALRGAPMPIYGDGLQVRDWLYVDDHVRALLTVIENGTVGATYNVAANHEIRNIDLAQQICDTLEHLSPSGGLGLRSYRDLITYVGDRPGHDRRYCIDASRITRELEWRPTTSFSEGLYRTLDWYNRNRDWCRDAELRLSGTSKTAL